MTESVRVAVRSSHARPLDWLGLVFPSFSSDLVQGKFCERAQKYAVHHSLDTRYTIITSGFATRSETKESQWTRVEISAF